MRIDANKVDNIFDAFIMYYGEGVECSPNYLRWAMMAALGAHLGREFYTNHGHWTIAPNLYVLLVGEYDAKTKDAIKAANTLLQLSGYKEFAADKSTKEKWLLDLANGSFTDEEDVSNVADAVAAKDINLLQNTNLFEVDKNKPRTCFINTPEFSSFVGIGMSADFLSVLSTLYDHSGVFRARTKTSKSIEITSPTISILSGTTHENFQLVFDPTQGGKEFLSKVILVHGEYSGKKLPFPEEPDSADTEYMLTFLEAIRSRVKGEATFTPDAKELLKGIYRDWEKHSDYRLDGYASERYRFLLKLCLLCAAARVSTEIDISDVKLANTTLRHAELGMPRALGEYGRNKHWAPANIILKFLENTVAEGNTGATLKQIVAKCGKALQDRRDLETVMNMLKDSNKIKFENEDNDIIYYPVKEVVDYTPTPVWDINLLWEVPYHG